MINERSDEAGSASISKLIATGFFICIQGWQDGEGNIPDSGSKRARLSKHFLRVFGELKICLLVKELKKLDLGAIVTNPYKKYYAIKSLNKKDYALCKVTSSLHWI